MEIWNSVYPGVRYPVKYTVPQRITEKGKNFVYYVVFESIGNNGVINITGTPSDCLLIYSTTFFKSHNTQMGGAIFCINISCVQVGVCNSDASSDSIYSYSFISSPKESNIKCQLFGCSLTKSDSKNNFFAQSGGNQTVKFGNFSYTSGFDQVERMINSIHPVSLNFSLNCNISSTGRQPVFAYYSTNLIVYQSIYLRNSNVPNGFGLVFGDANITFLECIFKENTGQMLFHPPYNGKYIVSNCFFYNPAWPNNGATYGPSTNILNLKLSFLSTRLCDADYPLLEYGLEKTIVEKENTEVENYLFQFFLSFSKLTLFPIIVSSS